MLQPYFLWQNLGHTLLSPKLRLSVGHRARVITVSMQPYNTSYRRGKSVSNQSKGVWKNRLKQKKCKWEKDRDSRQTHLTILSLIFKTKCTECPPPRRWISQRVLTKLGKHKVSALAGESWKVPCRHLQCYRKQSFCNSYNIFAMRQLLQTISCYRVLKMIWLDNIHIWINEDSGRSFPLLQWLAAILLSSAEWGLKGEVARWQD